MKRMRRLMVVIALVVSAMSMSADASAAPWPPHHQEINVTWAGCSVTFSIPGCGCDACDEEPADVAERMQRLIEAVTEGRYEEELTKRTLRSSFSGSWGSASSEGRLQRGEWRRHGEPGAPRWPPWPRRERS